MTTPSPEAMEWAARQILRQHVEPPDPDRATGSCAQCTDDGCRMLEWAEAVLHSTLVPAAS
ncbi:MAG: hypothetical protein J2P15_07980 [Micromonosporaceae bacterium]|nr:hypothetical protein [Micromonosporaceae bacterium]